MAPVSGLSAGSRESWRDPRRVNGLTIRTALVVGLILTGGIWLYAGSYFSARVRALESDAAELSRRYIAAQELLNATRSHVYRASIYVRDSLIDPEITSDVYRTDVEGAYAAADRLLASYVPVLDSRSERARTDRLREEIAELRRAMLLVLSADNGSTRSDAGALLRAHLPRRDAAIRVAEELQALNRTAYVAQQTETARLYRETQRRFWQTLGFAVLASLIVALFAWHHVSRLERNLRDEQEKDARTAADLQRLSARIVSVQEEERRIIARELHDEIGQVLSVVKMELTYAQREIASGRGGSELLDDARSITDRALRAARDISHLLHPPLLDDLGLPAAVDWYVQSIRKNRDLSVEFTHQSMGVRLPADVEVGVYRIVQEGLTNVLRHAEAKSCRVQLVRLNDRVTVTVEDDGVGFNPLARETPEDSSGLGLVGIRERVTRLSGMLRLESTPGLGTLLTAEIPLGGAPRGALVGSAALAPTEAKAG
jgi:signal transduction histidine kinase